MSTISTQISKFTLEAIHTMGLKQPHLNLLLLLSSFWMYMTGLVLGTVLGCLVATVW